MNDVVSNPVEYYEIVADDLDGWMENEAGFTILLLNVGSTSKP